MRNKAAAVQPSQGTVPDTDRKVDSDLQPEHLFLHTICKLTRRDLCYLHCYQDSYAADGAWRCAHILRVRMEHAALI